MVAPRTVADAQVLIVPGIEPLCGKHRSVTLGDVAVVRSFQPGDQRVRRHQTEVDCFYVVIDDDGSDALIHLTTFGSDDRQSKPKSSQTIQLDREVALQLAALIQDTFLGLER